MLHLILRYALVRLINVHRGRPTLVKLRTPSVGARAKPMRKHPGSGALKFCSNRQGKTRFGIVKTTFIAADQWRLQHGFRQIRAFRVYRRPSRLYTKHDATDAELCRKATDPLPLASNNDGRALWQRGKGAVLQIAIRRARIFLEWVSCLRNSVTICSVKVSHTVR